MSRQKKGKVNYSINKASLKINIMQPSGLLSSIYKRGKDRLHIFPESIDPKINKMPSFLKRVK